VVAGGGVVCGVWAAGQRGRWAAGQRGRWAAGQRAPHLLADREVLVPRADKRGSHFTLVLSERKVCLAPTDAPVVRKRQRSCDEPTVAVEEVEGRAGGSFISLRACTRPQVHAVPCEVPSALAGGGGGGGPGG
jgi:hypothetical protein